MKKSIIMVSALLAVALVAGYASADNRVLRAPRDTQGSTVHPLYGGYKYKRVDIAAEMMVCSSAPCILAQVYMSTGVNATRLEIRDTGTADGAGVLMFPMRRFENDCNAMRPLLDGPIFASNGISAKLTSIAANEEVVILYLDGL